MKLSKWLIIDVTLVAILGILAWIFGPSLFMEAQYQKQVKQQSAGEAIVGFANLLGEELESKQAVTWSYDQATPITPGFDEISNQQLWASPISPEFGLVIPKIFANVSVTANVNPADEAEYQSVLRQAGGVAHAAGSAVPGEPGTVYIFGHSTDSNVNVERYNAVFCLLKKLEPKDLIIAYYNGESHQYQVTTKKTVDPTDIDDITNVENQQRLVLQTCWPPGTTWKRLLIIADPISS